MKILRLCSNLAIASALVLVTACSSNAFNDTFLSRKNTNKPDTIATSPTNSQSRSEYLDRTLLENNELNYEYISKNFGDGEIEIGNYSFEGMATLLEIQREGLADSDLGEMTVRELMEDSGLDPAAKDDLSATEKDEALEALQKLVEMNLYGSTGEQEEVDLGLIELSSPSQTCEKSVSPSGESPTSNGSETWKTHVLNQSGNCVSRIEARYENVSEADKPKACQELNYNIKTFNQQMASANEASKNAAGSSNESKYRNEAVIADYGMRESFSAHMATGCDWNFALRF